MNITIIPQRVRMIRQAQDMKRADLAERSKISLRQIARIEDAKEETLTVREHTVMQLARALRTSPAVLKGEIPLLLENIHRNKPRDGGKTRVKLDPGLQFDFDMVQHRYGVSEKELVALAPTLFTLMAEACIVWHHKRQKKFESRIEDIKKTLPYDDCVSYAEGDESAILKLFQAAERINLATVSEKNLGGSIEDEDGYPDGYVSSASPFAVYLYNFLEKIVKDGVKSGMDIDESCTHVSSRSVDWQGIIFSEKLEQFGWPNVPNDLSNSEIRIFLNFSQELVGRDSDFYKNQDKDEFSEETNNVHLASDAIWNGYVRFTEIPKYLLGPENKKERIAWLISKLPPNYESNFAKRSREFNFASLVSKNSDSNKTNNEKEG